MGLAGGVQLALDVSHSHCGASGLVQACSWSGDCKEGRFTIPYIIRPPALPAHPGHAPAFVLLDLSLSGKSSWHGVLERRLGGDGLGA